VVESSGTVVITNGLVTAAAGTNTTAKQATFANDLALSIINKTGLTNQYTACVKTPSTGSAVPACSSYGITLAATNIVAVVPIDCGSGATSKAIGQCSLLPDATRSGWAVTVQATPGSPAQPATAILKVAGAASTNKTPSLASLKLGSTSLLTSLSFSSGASSTDIAATIAGGISATGITAKVGGTSGYSDACSAAATTSVCIMTTLSGAANQSLTIGTISNNSGSGGSARNGSIVLTGVSTVAAVAAVTDTIPSTTAPIGAGSAIFVRVDIIPARTTYPKATLRTDCVTTAGICSYDEEMTNFANWYTYYKSRNQMMKTSVAWRSSR
jgi:type IV pilus assembly protein PilY1